MLPAQIEEIKVATEKLEQEMFKPEGGDKPPGETPPKPGDQPPPKPDEPPPAETPPADETPKPSDTPPPDTTPPPDAPPPPEDFEHKYKVLQGKYNKEIKEALAKSKQATDRLLEVEGDRGQLLQKISNLTARLEQLEKGKESAAQPVHPTGDLAQDLAELEKTPEGQYLKTEFSDLWKAMSKLMVQAVNQKLGDTRSRIDKVEKDVKTSVETIARTSQNSFYQYLDENVKEWNKINTSPEFRAWLEEKLPYSGVSKLELIKEKIANLDGPGTAEFFVDFEESSKPPAEDTPPPDNPPPANQPKKSSTVAPPKGKVTTPPKKPVTEDTITPEHITDFYLKVQRGYYQGREAERSAEEKKIEKAVAEGRVVSPL